LRGLARDARQAVLYGRDPAEFFAQYAPGPTRIDTSLGSFVVLAESESVRDVFSGDMTRFEVAEARVDALEPLLGAHSLLLLSGDRHRRHRKLLMPSFHGARMRAYGSAMQAAARRHAQCMPIGTRFAMLDLTQAISLDIIVETVFGVTDAARRERLAAAIQRVVNALGPVSYVLPAARVELGGVSPWARFLRARARLLELLREEVTERRRAPAEDITSMMIAARTEDGEGLSDDEIVDEMVTLLVAGHETTAIGMAWAMYDLLLDRPALVRLRAELDAHGASPPETIARLPYLSRVCSESLRLHPIVADVTRKLTRDDVIGGMQCRRGETLLIAVTEIHRDSRLYPDPERFDPDRFERRRFKAWEYLPFGGGDRRCIGASFAEFEMRVVLAEILTHWELGLAVDRPLKAVRRNVTLAPSGGVPVVALGRRGELG
jgi:cytochrome P450